jgi:hypothetical protein
MFKVEALPIEIMLSSRLEERADANLRSGASPNPMSQFIL